MTEWIKAFSLAAISHKPQPMPVGKGLIVLTLFDHISQQMKGNTNEPSKAIDEV